MSRLFGYGRVSTREQNSQNQLLEMRSRGFDVADSRWFYDVASGASASSQRPEFSRLLDRLECGDKLVVSKLDRLGRNSVDVEKTITELEVLKIEVVILQLGTLDLASSSGRFMRQMLSAVAELERSLIVERINAGLARAKSEDVRLGRPPKTTPAQRQKILATLKAGTSISSLARDYSISRSSILTIKNAAAKE